MRFGRIIITAVCAALIAAVPAVPAVGGISCKGISIEVDNDFHTAGDYTYFIHNDRTVSIYSYSGSDTDVVIPDELDGMKVTSLAAYSFMRHNNLKSIVIPDGVTSIYDRAFYECPNLNSISIPKSVCMIDGSAFWDTKWIAAKQKKDPLVIINDIVVDGRSCTGNVVIPEGIKRISMAAFYGCEDMKSVKLPDSIESIGEYAFSYCRGLSEIVIPKEINAIAAYAFEGCSGLRSVTFPDGLISVQEYGFDGCTGLTDIVFPESFCYIFNGAFNGCSNLRNVIFPVGLKVIYPYAFYNCPKLRSVRLYNNVFDIGTMALGYQSDSDKQDEKFTVFCYKNGRAEEYALDNGLNCQLLVTDPDVGDVNDDGKVNMKDMVMLQRHLNEWITGIDLTVSDLNADGKVNMKDYVALQRQLNGWTV